MNIYSFPPITILLNIFYTALTFLSSTFENLMPISGAGLGIIALTLIVRALLLPVGISRRKAEVNRNRLRPQLLEIQRKYKNRTDLLQQKTMELYRKEGVSPLAGCLPALLQLPILMGIYGVFLVPTIGGTANELLEKVFFEVPLGQSLIQHFSLGIEPPVAILFGVIMTVLFLTAELQRRLLFRNPLRDPSAELQTGALKSFSTVAQWLPYFSVLMPIFLPLAATLYLATTMIITLVEKLLLRKIYRS